MHKHKIKLNCLDDEYEDFTAQLYNDFENSDYCVMMEKLRDHYEKARCEIKFNEITEMRLNMFVCSCDVWHCVKSVFELISKSSSTKKCDHMTFGKQKKKQIVIYAEVIKTM